MEQTHVFQSAVQQTVLQDKSHKNINAKDWIYTLPCSFSKDLSQPQVCIFY